MASEASPPYELLPTRRVAKPWGVDALPAPFDSDSDERIGEIWFEPDPRLSQLLIKYIFTSEKLSVQVHPSDAQTLADGLGRQGKEECWLVIHAEPGARLGIGFDVGLSHEKMETAARDGSIEALMTWHEVQAGDFFYIPAGTVHAIGAGISVIEIQQNSDITYRLFDYGRPRELHLEDGISVAVGLPYDRARWHRHVPSDTSIQLVDGPYFKLDQVTEISQIVQTRYSGSFMVIPRSGSIIVADRELVPGECALVQDLSELRFGEGSIALFARPVEGTETTDRS